MLAPPLPQLCALRPPGLGVLAPLLLLILSPAGTVASSFAPRIFKAFARGHQRTCGPAWPERYVIANELRPPGSRSPPGFTNRGEAFDLYSDPIELGYGEVHFRFQPTTPLPHHIVERFSGKLMAVTGYEVNVVRVNAHGEEEAVPAYDAYNHHYALTMKGANASEDGEDAVHRLPPLGDNPMLWSAAGLGDGLLDSQWFSEGNGNEHRLSFHGYPPGYAQVIRSPNRMVNFFHLINTRGGGGRGGPGSSLLPRNSQTEPGAHYCGLIECPCTDRRDIDVAAGTIDGKPVGFNCRGELAAQNNTACSLSTYRGGLRCCEDGVVLLDADQQPPPGKDTLFMKMRFWFEESPAATNLVRLFWATDLANGEYDVPPCAPKSTPCVHVLKTDFTVDDMCRMYGCGPSYRPDTGLELIYAGGHLHVGGLSIELINADTGELLCVNTPQYGTSDAPMDEEGYIVGIPPCLWSHSDPRLPNPPRLKGGTRLVSIAKYHNDPGHWGAMAFWQMRGTY